MNDSDRFISLNAQAGRWAAAAVEVNTRIMQALERIADNLENKNDTSSR